MCSRSAGYYQFYSSHFCHYWFKVGSRVLSLVSASSTPFDLLLWWRWGFWHYPSSSQIPELQSECLLRAGQHVHLCNIGYVSCINFIISRQVWSIKRIQTQQFQIRLCLELYMVRLLPAVEKNIWTRAQYILFGTIVKIKYKMKTILEQGVIKFPETCISLLLKIL